jgi:hypothetical protein
MIPDWIEGVEGITALWAFVAGVLYDAVFPRAEGVSCRTPEGSSHRLSPCMPEERWIP